MYRHLLEREKQSRSEFGDLHKVPSFGARDNFPLFGRPLWMLGANMRVELFLALPLIVLFHFLKSVADERS